MTTLPDKQLLNITKYLRRLEMLKSLEQIDFRRNYTKKQLMELLDAADFDVRLAVGDLAQDGRAKYNTDGTVKLYRKQIDV